MSVLFSIVGILLGVVAASSVIISKIPDAEEHISKLKKYEGYIGATAVLFAIFQLFSLNRVDGLSFLLAVVAIVSFLVAGTVLGWPIIQELVVTELEEKNRKKADVLYNKLIPYKVMAGLVSMGLGILFLIL